MLNKKKKQVIYALLIVLGTIILVAANVCFYFAGKKTDTTESISTSFKDSSSITIKNTLPISDALGKKIDGKGTKEGIQGYSELTIHNNMDTKVAYDICVKKVETANEIRGNYIKFYLADTADNPMSGFESNTIPTFNDLPVLVSDPGLYLLTSDSLQAQEIKTIVLRSWLSDSYAISDESRDFTFTIVVKAK